MDSRSLLLLEDDPATASFLADNLSADGFRVTTAAACGEGWRAVEARRPDLILLDLGLADGSGLELLDRVRGFARGADDYVSKPFSYAELVARIRAVLRRSDLRAARGLIRVGELSIDPLKRVVTLEGEAVYLSAKEFALLHTLATDPTRVFLKAELLRDVWGYQTPGSTRTLDAHACRVRRKLSASARPLVITVRGVGYRLTDAL